MAPVLALVAALVLVAVNGALVAAEFAMVRVRRTRLEELAGEGREQAKEAIILVDRVSDYLATTQVGITAASLGVGWLGEGAFARLMQGLWPRAASNVVVHGVAASLAFGFFAMLQVVVGELVPKNLAIAGADHLLLKIAGPLRVAHVVLGPLSRLLTRLAGSIQRLLGHTNAPPLPLSESELKLILSDSQEGGVITEGEAKIILRAFEFADKRAEEIMVPIEAVDYISRSRTFDENLRIAEVNMHARLPLCEAGPDSVIGIVAMKDVWPLLRSRRSNAIFEHARRPLTKVACDLSQEVILRRLQQDGAQMGVVRDSSDRTTLGIVTLEDVLESLVGDVREARLAPLRGGEKEAPP
jgi:CBS domain containing-hemolysin-like protein